MSISDAALPPQAYTFPPPTQNDGSLTDPVGGQEPDSVSPTSKLETPPHLTKALVLSVMAAVDSSLNIEFQDTDIADVIDVDEHGLPFVQEIQAQPESVSSGRSSSRGPKNRHPSRSDSTKPGVAKANGLNHYRLICEACSHIVIAVVSAVLKAVQEAYEENSRRFDSSARPVAPVRKKRGGILGFKELAAKAKLSPWHFHRVFRNVTGVTPKAYGEALWDYLMRLYGFEVDELTENHASYSVNTDSPDLPPLNNPHLGLSSDMPSFNSGLPGNAGGNTNILGSMENGAVPASAQGQHVGRIRKSTRAAQQRSSRSRSRNRSQTQQQLLQTLSQMQISAPRKRSPSPGPNGQYMGSPLLPSQHGGRGMSPTGPSGFSISNSQLDMYGSLVEDDIGLYSAGPTLAGTEDNLNFIFPSISNNYVEQGYDHLSIKEEFGGDNWVEQDRNYMPKPMVTNNWAGPDLTLAGTPSEEPSSLGVANTSLMDSTGVTPNGSEPGSYVKPHGDRMSRFNSSSDMKSSWASQDPSTTDISRSMPSQGLMLSMSPSQNPPPASSSNIGFDTSGVLSEDNISGGYQSYYLQESHELDHKSVNELDFSEYTTDGDAPLSSMLLGMQTALSPTIEEDGIQNPVYI